MNYFNIRRFNDFYIQYKRDLYFISLIFVPVMIFLSSGCAKNQEQMRPMEEIPVNIGTAITMDVPVRLSAIGTVQAYATVNISSHVGGEVTQIHVREGQTIKKGQLLFTIDDREYQAALESARANLEKDRIQLEKEKTDAQRYAELLKKDYVTRSEVEQAQNDVEVREATIKGDEAEIKSAELNLSYCRITAPINGRAGAILVDQGNIITANNNSNPLMIINQIQPIYIQFSVPEQYLPEIRSQLDQDASNVLIYTPENTDVKREGRLTFMNNAIDADTGTIELMAAFENEDNALWPGQFVNVILVLGVKTGAVVVPSDSVQISQDGHYIFVVDSANTVEAREVTIGSEVGDLTEITEGISNGEVVVTEGQLKLSEGTKISVKNATQMGSEAKQ